MNKVFFITILFFTNFVHGVAQQMAIKGSILLNKKITEGVYIQIINPQNNNIIAFAATQSSGNYVIDLNTNLKKVTVKISHIGYTSIDTLITLDNATTNLDFDLQINNQTLDPINIIVTKPIDVNGDTTSYNVASFKKGEKSIEGLLKKLPGFDVDDKGKIKFKNKPIKTILLDGDDVVKGDYQVLSKNITPDMVDKIQAIENYNDNELLAGITKGDETVLNLKINKKFKGIVNVKTSALSTLKDSLHQIDNTALAIFKNLKVINVFNKNNIGKYNNANYIEENNQDNLAFSNALIDNDYLQHLNDESIEKFNNNWTNNFNLLFKRKDKFEINGRYAYFNDVQKTINNNSTEYITTSPALKIDENIQRITKATVHKVNLFAKIYTSRLSFLTFKLDSRFIKSSLFNQNVNTFNTQANTNTDTINFYNNNLYFIKKLNLKNALELEVNYQNKNNPQSLLITPGIYNTFFNSGNYDTIYQTANTKEQNWSNEMRITGYNKWVKYKLKTGYLNKVIKDSSIIELVKNLASKTDDSLKNNLKVKTKSVYLNITLEKALLEQKLNVKIENIYTYSWLNASGIKSGHQLFYTPTLSLDYKVSRFGNLTFNYSRSSSFIESKNYLENYFLRAYNVLVKNNITEPLTEKKQEYKLDYNNFNLFKNRRFILIGTSYNRNRVYLNHFSQNYLDYYIDRNEKLQTPVTNTSWTNYIIISRLVSPIHNTFKLNLFYFYTKTIVPQNTFDTSIITSNVLSSTIGLVSNFKGAFNYEIKAGINYNKNRSISNSINNNFENIAYNAAIALSIDITKDFKSHLSFRYNRNTISTCYLDANLEYSFPKKEITITTGGQNLFNNTKIVNYYSSEFFIQKNQSILFPRFIYLKFGYNFSFKL